MAAGDVSKKTSIKQVFQSMTAGEMEVLQGVVKSENPLKIQIMNDEKIVIGPNITYVPKHLTDHTVKVSFAKGADGAVNGSVTGGESLTDITFTGTMTVRNALKKSDLVHLLSFHHGKQYYVLDRVEK